MLLAALLIVVGMLWLWGMWRAEPDYWQTVDANAPNVARTAAQFETWVAERFTARHRDGDSWRIELGQRRINEWLATRARRWAANQQVEIPAQVREVIVAIRPDEVILAGRINYGPASQVLSLIGRPTRPNEDDVLHAAVVGARVGKVPVPVTWAFDQIPTNEGLKRTYRLTLPLGDGRVVEVVDAKLADGRVVLTCRTVR